MRSQDLPHFLRNRKILHIHWLKAASTHIKSVIILGLYRCQRLSLYALLKKWLRKWNGLQILIIDFLPWEIFSIWISIAYFCYFVDISAQNWHFFLRLLKVMWVLSDFPQIICSYLTPLTTQFTLFGHNTKNPTGMA